MRDDTSHVTADFAAQYVERRWSLSDVPGLGEKRGEAPLFAFTGTTIADARVGMEEPGEAGRREWAYMLSQYFHGELFAVRVCERLLAELPPSHPLLAVVRIVLADEKLHCEAIRTYLERRVGLFFDHAPPFAQVCDEALSRQSPVFATAALYLVVEPFGLGSIASRQRSIADPVCSELIARLMRDEAQHLRFGPHLLNGIVESGDELRAWLGSFIDAMRVSSCSTEVLAPFCSRADELSRAARAAMRGPVMRRQAKHVLTALLRSVREVPRLEGLGLDAANLLRQTE